MTEQNRTLTNCITLLKENKNLILNGAPGTGKTYLAKRIALKMIFPDCDFDIIDLDGGGKMSAEQIALFNSHYKMVQFHPSYDYTDFVEGLRPVGNDDTGNMRFERKDGAFKEFCKKALEVENGKLIVDNFEEAWKKLAEYLDENDSISVPLLSGKDSFAVEFNEYGTGLANRTYEGNQENWIRGKSKFFSKEQLYNIYKGLPGTPAGGHDNYRKAIVKMMKEKFGLKDYSCQTSQLSTVNSQLSTNYLFHIDEINRGEVSRIFGELFFCAEPSYRGEKGLIQTQYQNLVPEGDAFKNGFFIPQNVFIIGTMNDIDRSVETMDFAFRRRFLFCEITAEESAVNMKIEGIALQKMSELNKAISNPEIGGLDSSFHIGASYFKDCNGDNANFEELWNYKLEPLLKEYLRGTENIEEKIEKLRNVFELKNSANENSQNENEGN